MAIPDPILVPIIVLLGCAFLAGWYGRRRPPEPVGWNRHPSRPRPPAAHDSAGDPLRCPVCRATMVDPWWKPADDLIVRRRLARYVAGREPGASK